MDWGGLFDRLLGFMPERSIFWYAFSTALLVVLGHYTYRWLQEVTKLPWMKEENQQKRREVLQGESRGEPK